MKPADHYAEFRDGDGGSEPYPCAACDGRGGDGFDACAECGGTGLETERGVVVIEIAGAGEAA